MFFFFKYLQFYIKFVLISMKLILTVFKLYLWSTYACLSALLVEQLRKIKHFLSGS